MVWEQAFSKYLHNYDCVSANTNENYPLPACYCTISCIYAPKCAATAVAVCHTIIKRPLGVFSVQLRKFGSLPKQEISPKQSKATHVLAVDRMCLLLL